MYEIVVGEFLNSGLTQAALSRRLGRRPEVVNRVLSEPANLTLDTVSDFLFAISGAEPLYGVRYPLDEPPRNYRRPEWLYSSGTSTSGVAIIAEWNEPNSDTARHHKTQSTATYVEILKNDNS